MCVCVCANSESTADSTHGTIGYVFTSHPMLLRTRPYLVMYYSIDYRYVLYYTFIEDELGLYFLNYELAPHRSVSKRKNLNIKLLCVKNVDTQFSKTNSNIFYASQKNHYIYT